MRQHPVRLKKEERVRGWLMFLTIVNETGKVSSTDRIGVNSSRMIEITIIIILYDACDYA